MAYPLLPNFYTLKSVHKPFQTGMPSINYKMLKWARKNALLSLDEATKKLGVKDGVKASADEKLKRYEKGEKVPSRAMLLKMANQYHTPLLTFYLSNPPRKGDRGEDFRTLPGHVETEQDAYVDVLIRDIKARQSTVREALLNQDESFRLDFIGRSATNEGVERIAETLHNLLGFEFAEFRSQKTVEAAFKLLRQRVEQNGIFVILKGNLGSYHSDIDVKVFRGFALSDDVAPFIVINDRDAKSAWSFTLLHELTHLLLGQTGISGAFAELQIEKFCNEVASQVLLPDADFDVFQPASFALEELIQEVSDFALSFKVSSSHVAYRLYKKGDINEAQWYQLRDHYQRKWIEGREATREKGRNQEGGPSYYVVNRYRLGSLVGLVQRLTYSGAISTTKAGMLLGIRPLKVHRLFESAR